MAIICTRFLKSVMTISPDKDSALKFCLTYMSWHYFYPVVGSLFFYSEICMTWPSSTLDWGFISSFSKESKNMLLKMSNVF